jgi:hypothetical protein
VNGPRPKITWARPPEKASTVANRCKTRTGSSEDSTVTPEASLIRSVRVAIPANTISGGGDCVLGPVMPTQGDHVDPQLVGQQGLLDNLPDRAGVGEQVAVVVLADVAERVEPELERSGRTGGLGKRRAHSWTASPDLVMARAVELDAAGAGRCGVKQVVLEAESGWSARATRTILLPLSRPRRRGLARRSRARQQVRP